MLLNSIITNKILYPHKQKIFIVGYKVINLYREGIFC